MNGFLSSALPPGGPSTLSVPCPSVNSSRSLPRSTRSWLLASWTNRPGYCPPSRTSVRRPSGSTSRMRNV
ncbi:hypothetical protein BD626DRAFT_484982 [Schizophyllum amplum]|uniref:Uncharacterized protein n=1 Tax=Schizophyllum amplum TaxID=97359 RepID=A0A550CQV8_9AGAR|nr:hypothetical protein BD626DRAFT_484982 [Auriculariopsis ampla]